MSEIKIVKLNQDSVNKLHLDQVREIFYESSTKKEFSSREERDEFEWKYLGHYLKNYPEFSFIALKGEKVLGYLVSMPETNLPELYQIQPHLHKFEHLYNEYPAHLHMNMHHESRGQGIGGLLLGECLDLMRQRGVFGLHILTGKDSKNRDFYTKYGLNYTVVIEGIAFHGLSLV